MPTHLKGQKGEGQETELSNPKDISPPTLQSRSETVREPSHQPAAPGLNESHDGAPGKSPFAMEEGTTKVPT